MAEVQTDVPAAMNAESCGEWVYDPFLWTKYAEDHGIAASAYRDQDVSMTVWNLLPGQEHSRHLHPERAHIIVVMTGTGLHLVGEADSVPIKAGDFIFVPRQTIHGILNNSDGPLSYATLSNNNQAQNVAVPVGAQVDNSGKK